ncbi:N-acetylglucosamine-6-phosphate deacetylase [Paenibacillus sp. XY044]|uniref:N-acetylglucosamine-6-phosphate deacetylase n=1 Tax=Paenibacillus sp. XY044 TaxID=2026089 RepID=UPI000B99B59C|nr:amidohydrolase family protein [Paenibacillus sp. XY044]OZB92880.1 N-acetylglucosamine-6-phosphate deacetylase [Paenibacillus sp. XY044]
MEPSAAGSRDARTRLEGIHALTGEHIRLTLAGGVIAGYEVLGTPEGAESRREAAAQMGEQDLPLIGPGLVDLQINGYAGLDLNTHPLQADTVRRLNERLWAEGVTSYFPTLITNSDEALRSGLGTIAEMCESGDHNMAGIHLEGPFISPEDGPRGAHDARYVRAPDWELFQSWQEAAGGRIRIVTVSPEWPEAVDFIERCTDSGVLVSIGHTAASSAQIQAAVQAGARMSTHLGNGAHPVLPRHPNYIWDQLAEEPLWASVIADGFHLPDAFLRVAAKVKGERLILVSDAVSFGGMPPGTYDTHIGGRVTLTPAGRLHLAGQPALLAGSALPMTAGIAHLAGRGIASLGEAWAMASVRPASLLGLPAAQGLAPGAPADVALFTKDTAGIRILRTYKRGQLQYDASDAQDAGFTR